MSASLYAPTITSRMGVGSDLTSPGVNELLEPPEPAPAGIRSLSSWVRRETNRLPTIAEPSEAPIWRK